MTISIPAFDTDAMRQIADYKPIDAGQYHPDLKQYILVEWSVWRVLFADHIAAADHIDLLEFDRKQRAA